MNPRQWRAILIALCLALLCQAMLPTMPVLAAEPEITFSIGDGVTVEDEVIVREGIEFAQSYVDDQLAPFPESRITVNVRQTRDTTGGNAVAFSAGNYIVVFTRSPGWKSLAPFDRLHVMVHEYIHSWQRATVGREDESAPLWLIEGSAEYLSYDAVARDGLVRRQEVIDAQSWSVVHAPEMAALDQLEDRDAYYGEAGPVYSLALLAVTQLAQEGGPAAISRFFEAMGDGDSWQEAFATAFGQEVDAFYRSFDRARADLIAPRDLPDSFLPIKPVHTESPIHLAPLPETAAGDEQVTVIGDSEPGATCTMRLRNVDSGERLTRTTYADGAGRLFWLVTIPPEFGSGKVRLSANCGDESATGSFTVEP
jgi:hypothetical protein